MVNKVDWLNTPATSITHRTALARAAFGGPSKGGAVASLRAALSL
jgi:hypothetical protein